MRFRHISAVFLALAVACASDTSGPATSAVELARGEATALTGEVFGLRPGPDSSFVPVRGAEVIISFIDSIPTDTVPVDTVPIDTIPVDTVLSDSMLMNGLVLRRVVLDSGVVDTIPVDTIPVDTVPPDTTPTDSNPPPPPPPGCGRTAEVVAHLRTADGGRFRIMGLAPGNYDFQVTPVRGSTLGTLSFCGVHLLPH